MDKKLKAKWLKALRSGEYQQGQALLKNTDSEGIVSYCCLGVLKSLDPKIRKQAAALEFLSPTYCGISQDIQETLAGMNDGNTLTPPKSFRVIANWIEKNL